MCFLVYASKSSRGLCKKLAPSAAVRKRPRWLAATVGWGFFAVPHYVPSEREHLYKINSHKYTHTCTPDHEGTLMYMNKDTGIRPRDLESAELFGKAG